MAGAWHLPLERAGSERRQCELGDGRGHGGKTGDGREMALARFCQLATAKEENPVQSN